MCFKRKDRTHTHTRPHTLTYSSRRRCSYPIKHVISHLTSQIDNAMLLCKETIDDANNNMPPRFLPHNVSSCQMLLGFLFFPLSHFDLSCNIYSSVRQGLHTCSTCCKSLFNIFGNQTNSPYCGNCVFTFLQKGQSASSGRNSPTEMHGHTGKT